jgi:hypothetical protein
VEGFSLYDLEKDIEDENRVSKRKAIPERTQVEKIKKSIITLGGTIKGRILTDRHKKGTMPMIPSLQSAKFTDRY